MLSSNSLISVDTKNLIEGIPTSNFACYGPTRQQISDANTRMLCGGRLCLVHCKDNYKPFSKIPFVYVCHKDGYWTTIPFMDKIKGYEIEWPVCYYDEGL